MVRSKIFLDEHRPNHSWRLSTWAPATGVGCDCHIKVTKVECRIHTKDAKVARVSAESNQIVQGVVHGYQHHRVWGCIHHSNELALTFAFSLLAHVHNSIKRLYACLSVHFLWASFTCWRLRRGGSSIRSVENTTCLAAYKLESTLRGRLPSLFFHLAHDAWHYTDIWLSIVRIAMRGSE